MKRHDEVAFAAEHPSPVVAGDRFAGKDLQVGGPGVRATVEQSGIAVVRQRRGRRGVGRAVFQSLTDRRPQTPRAQLHVAQRKQPHDDQDRRADANKTHDLAEHDFESRDRLGHDRVNDAGFDFLRQIGARQDDCRNGHDQSRGKQAEFRRLPDRILLVGRVLQLRDDDHADDGQRNNPQHATANRFAKTNPADRPGPAEAEMNEVAKSIDQEAEQDDQASDRDFGVAGDNGGQCGKEHGSVQYSCAPFDRTTGSREKSAAARIASIGRRVIPHDSDE